MRNVCEEFSRLKKQHERGLVPDDHVMNGAELAKVAQVSMEKMKDYMDQPEKDRRINMTAALQYSRYLLTCTLASIATPRTQVDFFFKDQLYFVFFKIVFGKSDYRLCAS